MFDCELKGIFHKRRIRQREFAERIGISQGALSQIVNEQTYPKFEVMYRICEELDLDVREIWKRKCNQ